MPSALVDPDDNLWILRYRFRGDANERWDVFDPAGTFLGTVECPERFSLTDIGRESVLGVWTGPDRVEHVRMFALVK